MYQAKQLLKLGFNYTYLIECEWIVCIEIVSLDKLKRLVYSHILKFLIF